MPSVYYYYYYYYTVVAVGRSACTACSFVYVFSVLIHGQVGWTFLGSSALPIFSLSMSGTGLGALSYGVIASARSPGAGVLGSARSFGDKGGSGSNTGRVPVLCEPQTLAAPTLKTLAEEVVLKSPQAASQEPTGNRCHDMLLRTQTFVRTVMYFAAGS